MLTGLTSSIKQLAGGVARFLAEEEGPTAVEYAMMLLLILLACLTAINMVGQSTANSLQSSQDSIEQAMGGGS